MSALLQDVLRTQQQQSLHENLAARLDSVRLSSASANAVSVNDDEHPARSPSPTSGSDDELINVQTTAASPTTASRTGSRPGSRAHSPTRAGASSRRVPGPLLISKSRSKKPTPRDPLKALPTEISQRIFGDLTIKQLARCARVSHKWNQSQTLNYIWFQHYRKENFHDESLPPGKWTRRESKQNWRTTYLEMRKKEEKEAVGMGGLAGYRGGGGGGGGYNKSGAASGYQTPREIKEEQWKAEAEASSKPAKNEMREMYKELGGRKAKSKAKYQAGANTRDRGGWTNHGDD